MSAVVKSRSAAVRKAIKSGQIEQARHLLATMRELQLGLWGFDAKNARDNTFILPADAVLLAEALTDNSTLTKLGLHCNRIGDAGMQALAFAVRSSPSITSVDFSSNEIGSDGAIALAEALNDNRSIANINLSKNNIGDDGAIALAAALHVSDTVRMLDLESNILGESGSRALLNAVKQWNVSLVEINLNGQAVVFDLEVYRQIKHFCKMNLLQSAERIIEVQRARLAQVG